MTAGDITSRYEALVREYYAACNAGDAERIAVCFVRDGVHYFPPGAHGGPFIGATTIGRRWSESVECLGSRWVIDEIVVDPARHLAILEWTHFKTRAATVLRGTEWITFNAARLRIQEIRAYYAAPQMAGLTRLELEGFDYTSRGYAMEPEL